MGHLFARGDGGVRARAAPGRKTSPAPSRSSTAAAPRTSTGARRSGSRRSWGFTQEARGQGSRRGDRTAPAGDRRLRRRRDPTSRTSTRARRRRPSTPSDHLRRGRARRESRRRLIYHYELGHAAWHAARHEDAREIARAIEQLWPESPERWFAIGRTLSRRRPVRGDRARSLKASDPLPRAHRAREMITIYARRIGPRSGIRRARLAMPAKASRSDPSRARSHASLGLVLRRRRTSPERRDPRARRRRSGSSPTTKKPSGSSPRSTCCGSGPRDALAPAREAVRLDPQDASGLERPRHRASSASAGLDEAGRDFEQGLKIEPDNPERSATSGPGS